MKSAAILLPHSVILNAPFVVVYLSVWPYISLSSLHNVYFCSDSRHVRSDALLVARIQKLPGKFSGKIDIAQEAVKIRRGNIAAAKFVRLAIK